MKRILLISSLLILLISIPVISQEKVNLTGTWVGTATLEGASEPNELTLVLVKKEGKLTGTMTGEYGIINKTPLINIILETNILTFDLDISSPGGDATLKFKMTVKDDLMSGSMDIPDMGMNGTWEAKRSGKIKTDTMSKPVETKNIKDLTGTWKGHVTLTIDPDPRGFTLILQEKDGILSGKMVDELGHARDTPLQKISFADNILSFEIVMGRYIYKYKMKVKGNLMEGEIEISGSDTTGTYKAKREKK